MQILLTGVETPRGQALAEALASAHHVRQLEATALGDRAALAEATRGVEAVVHIVASPGDQADGAVAALDQATRGTYDLLTAAHVPVLVLVTTLGPFARYDAALTIGPEWTPRPRADLDDLAPFLAELTAREVSRVRQTRVAVVRAGVAADASVAAEVAAALAWETDEDDRSSTWRVRHVGDRPPASVSSQSPTPPVARPVRRVTIFGAGGPLGAVTAEALAHDHVLRLTDARPWESVLAASPQSPGAPVPTPYAPPHETVTVDVTDAGAVAQAAVGADALVNCTVVRRDPVEAFQVNVLGALNVMQAAVAHGIRRVVQTGPLLTLLGHPGGYGAEFGLSDDLPPRPGDDLYFVTKFLGQEICRVFAEEHGLSVPTLLFTNFYGPETPVAGSRRFYPFAVSWADSGEAMRRAVMVPDLPRPFEPLHVVADLPHGKYPNTKAKQLLGWQPRDDLARFWTK
jgi:nucleoside-diphosphate-sugar epimerase